MGPELITEGSKYDQTLMQGSYKLNRGHRSVTQAEAVTGRGSYARGEGSLSALMMRKVTLVTAVMKAARARACSEASGGSEGCGSTGMQGTAAEGLLAQGTAARGCRARKGGG